MFVTNPAVPIEAEVIPDMTAAVMIAAVVTLLITVLTAAAIIAVVVTPVMTVMTAVVVMAVLIQQ